MGGRFGGDKRYQTEARVAADDSELEATAACFTRRGWGLTLVKYLVLGPILSSVPQSF